MKGSRELSHRGCQGALRGWLDEQRLEEAEGASSVEEQILGLLALTRTLAQGVGAIFDGVAVVDHTKYDFIEERLEQILSFDEFSLAEVSFRFPDRRQPGLRLWLEGPAGARRVSVIAFDDVVRWRAGYDGERLSTTLLTLELDHQRRQDGPWRDRLTEAFCAAIECPQGELS